jgi:hypothetical protein
MMPIEETPMQRALRISQLEFVNVKPASKKVVAKISKAMTANDLSTCKVKKGDPFNSWTVIGSPYVKMLKQYKKVFILCQCKCGTQLPKLVYDLLSGKATRCKYCTQKIVADKNRARHKDNADRKANLAKQESSC